MKKSILLMMFISASTAAGTKDSGGDPMTQQFLRYGQQLSIFVKQNPFQSRLEFSAADFDARMKLLDESIKDERLPDLIEFTDEALHDKDGREKAATFNPDSGLIRVNRHIWAQYTVRERLVLTVMEISGLLKTPVRYESAEALVQDREALITSIPLARDKIEIPGWHILGENSEQFARITDDASVIDLDVLGKGGEKNAIAVKFLKDPASQPEWVEQILRAWANGKSAFLETRAINERGASITSFYIARTVNGLVAKAYTLLFHKVGQAFSGPCADEGNQLTTRKRIRDCYLNPTYYVSSDRIAEQEVVNNTEPDVSRNIIALVKELGVQLEDFYARDPAVMSEALRSYYIPDYSMVTPTFDARMQATIINANGLVPTLMGPFTRAPFWTRAALSTDPKTTRLNAAATVLAQLDLVYASINIRCPAVSSDLPGNISGQIVSRDQYVKYLESGKCRWTYMGEAFPGALYQAMVNAGFYYDYAQKKWFFGPEFNSKQKMRTE